MQGCGADGGTAGVFVAALDTATLNKIAGERAGLGKSGEIVLVNDEGYPLTPLRYRENAVLDFKIDSEIVNECIEDMKNYSGIPGNIGEHDEKILTYNDYRGVGQLGTHTYALPEAKWCVIAKIDRAEALQAPLDRLFSIFIYAGASLLALSSVAIYPASGLVSRPIRQLSDDVERITKGDLSIRLKESRFAEIQQLTYSLNRILASMKLAILRAGMTHEELGLGEALAAKRVAEDRYRALYENSLDAIILAGLDGKFVSGNPAAIKMFGAKDESEFLGLGPQNTSPQYQPNGRLSSEMIGENIRTALKDGNALFEWVHRRKDGSEFTVSVLLARMDIGGKELLQATVRDISAEKEAVEKLAYEQKFSKTLMTAFSEGIDVVDEDLNIVFMNPAFTNIFGEKAIGKKCYQVYKENKKQCEGCPLKRQLNIGETRSIVVPGIVGGKTFEITHTGVLLPNGKKAVIEVFRDVTAELESLDKVRMFEQGFDTSPDSQIMAQYVDGQPKIVKVNASFTKLYGYSSNEVLGKSPKILKSGVQEKGYYARMWNALLDPKVGYWRDEIVNRRKDGSHIEVFLSVSTIFGKDGKPKAFLANHSDMSKQKREERELASAKEFQKAAIDSLTDSFFICDTTGKFLSWNKEFARAVGYEDKEIAGMKATDFFKGTDALRVADAIRKGLKTGSGKVLANVVAKDGRRLPTEFSGAVIRNSKGKIIGFAGTGRRLTEGERTKE